MLIKRKGKAKRMRRLSPDTSSARVNFDVFAIEGLPKWSGKQPWKSRHLTTSSIHQNRSFRDRFVCRLIPSTFANYIRKSCVQTTLWVRQLKGIPVRFMHGHETAQASDYMHKMLSAVISRFCLFIIPSLHRCASVDSKRRKEALQARFARKINT